MSEEMTREEAITEQEPCEDTISRQAAIAALKKHFSDGIDIDTECGAYWHHGHVIEVLQGMPPVTPKQRTGHWIEIAQYSDGNHKIECSECKSHIFDRGHANSFNVKNKYKYCPNCGAKMESEEEQG